MDDSITHIAGPSIDLSGRIIQRCAVCGMKLLDSLDAQIPDRPDGSPPFFGVWECGRFVRFTGDSQTLLPRCDTLPKDHCLPLVE